MNVTQRIVGTGVALVIAVGGYGCRYALREATDDTADRIAEDAAESVSDRYVYEPPTIPTVTVTVPETTTPATTPPTEPAPETTAPTPTTTAPDALPEGWPAALKLADGLAIESTSDIAGLVVVGTVAGDVATVTEGVRGQLATAGFTVDDTRSAGGATVAVGADATATVLVSPVPEDPATVRVTYRIEPNG